MYEPKKKPGRQKGQPAEARNMDDRAKKYAQLAALGLKSKQIQYALGLRNQNSLKRLRDISLEQGYLQKLQDARDAQVIDIRAEVKTVAENCVTYLKASSEMAMTKIGKALIDNPGGDINIPEAKVITDIFNSTEYSGKKAEVPNVVVDIRAESGASINDAVDKIDRILAKYLTKEQAC